MSTLFVIIMTIGCQDEDDHLFAKYSVHQTMLLCYLTTPASFWFPF